MSVQLLLRVSNTDSPDWEEMLRKKFDGMVRMLQIHLWVAMHMHGVC